MLRYRNQNIKAILKEREDLKMQLIDEEDQPLSADKIEEIEG